jgi:cell division protein FtsI (penicillin-binding protein 3)
VVINDPTGDQYYGGAVAAPLFSTIMSGALRLLDVAPDDYEQVMAHSETARQTAKDSEARR